LLEILARKVRELAHVEFFEKQKSVTACFKCFIVDSIASVRSRDCFRKESGSTISPFPGRPKSGICCGWIRILGGFDVDVDVDRIGEENLAGTSTEFASGAEGVGAGSSGGVAIYYGIDSHGQGPVTSESNVSGVYKKVVGIAGGL
jgi:hypothetical protein